MSFGNDLREDLLDLVFAGEAYTPASNFQIALSTTAINDDGTGITEPVGNNYSRVTVPNDLTNWPVATTTDGGTPNGTTTKINGEDIEFPVATGTWGTITHFAVYDDAATPNFLGWGSIVTPRTIEEDDIALFQEESIEITLS